MAHLGYLLTALADGQLSAATAEKVLEHVAGCPECAAELAAERRARRLLAEAECAEVPAGLTERLRTIESSTPLHVAGPRHVRRAAAWLAAGSAVGASTLVATLFVLGGPHATTPALSDTGALTSLASVVDEGEADAVPVVARTVPGTGPFTVTGHRLLEAGGEVVELSGRGGHVVLVVQEGRLDAGSVAHLDPLELAGARRYVLEAEPWHAVWQAGDDVVEIVTDLPPQDVTEVVAHFPARDYDIAPSARIARGWSHLTGGWNR